MSDFDSLLRFPPSGFGGPAEAFAKAGRDLRYGLRQLWRAPAFAAAAILTLAIGIGANTAIFSMVNAVLLRPLPFPEPDGLVLVWTRLEKAGIPRTGVSPPELVDLTRQSLFEHVAGIYSTSLSLSSEDRPERVRALLVSPSAFPALRASAALGRTFLPEESEPGRERVVVLSHALWQRHFGARGDVLGESIQLDGEVYAIAGVMPHGFRFPVSEVDLWMPLAFGPEELSEDERGSHYLDVLARLKPGVSLPEASSSLAALAARLERDHPETYEGSGFGLGVGSLHEELVASSRTPIVLLLGAVAFVLLIACVNVANLLIARAAVREREMALRAALGAGRWRLAQQLVFESLLLALGGGAAGVLAAAWGVDLLQAVAPAELARLTQVSLDPAVLAYALALSCFTGIAFGLAPVLSLGSPDLAGRLKEASRGASTGRRGRSLRGLLVVLETALALVLLVGAALLLRSLFALGRVDPGIEPDRLLTLRLSLPPARYPDEPQLTAFREALSDGISALPGVRRVALASHLPLAGPSMSQNFTLEGPTAAGEGPQEHEFQTYLASAGYFDAMGIPLLRGQDFSGRETAASPLVAIVDKDLARRFWPEQDPVGRRIRIGGLQTEGSPWRTIVGVVGHVRHQRLDAIGREQIYLPFAQRPPPYARSLFVAIKTEGDPGALAVSVEKTIASLDPDLAVYDVKPMDRRVDAALAQPRFRTTLLMLFAATAVLLAAIGTYGVMAFAVEQRRRETGVRVALGARPGQVLALVLGDGMKLAAAGVGVGMALALALAQVLEGLLFEISALDPVTFAVVPTILALVALFATYLPARRATRADPVTALSSE